jgi:hypothetical protein
MGIAALITWMITAAGGLYMLLVWLIESDSKRPGATASRLPVAVVSGHLLLAVTGLLVWAVYLFTDVDRLAWTAFIILVTVALLGSTLFARWVPVYRSAGAVPAGAYVPGVPEPPAERYFPLTIVVGHGMFATTTLVLVTLTVLGVGGS